MDPHGTGMVPRTLEGTNDTDPAGEDEMVPFHPDFPEILAASVRATLGKYESRYVRNKKASPR